MWFFTLNEFNSFIDFIIEQLVSLEFCNVCKKFSKHLQYFSAYIYQIQRRFIVDIQRTQTSQNSYVNIFVIGKTINKLWARNGYSIWLLINDDE